MTSTTSDLPVVPLQRAAQCPLAPPIEFERWRQEPGLRRAMWNGQPTWIISRYQDIRAALVDPRLSADTLPDIVGPSSEESTPVIFARIDDPEHHRLRRMMTSQFTFRRTEAMRPEIQELVDHYLNKMIDAGPPADIVRDFALPVPSLVIALLLGVPPEDLELFQHNSSAGLDVNSTEEQRVQGFAEMYSLHPGVGGAESTRTRRRPDQPPGHRLRRNRPTRPQYRGRQRCDHDARPATKPPPT